MDVGKLEAMHFSDLNAEDPPAVTPSQRHELRVAILQVTAALLAIVPFFWPWAARHRIYAALVVVLVVGWIAKPRVVGWAQQRRYNRRDRQFVADNRNDLGRLVQRFAVFVSNHDNRSLIQILRSGYSQNMSAVEQIISADYIESWLYCYREHLRSARASSLEQFLSQCREFSHIVQAFNSYYALPAQRKLAVATPLSDDIVSRLEEFREEYCAFLREIEPWAQGIANYLQSKGVMDQSALWGLAPTIHFERPKSFRQTKKV